jgi:TIGR03009 family protein
MLFFQSVAWLVMWMICPANGIGQAAPVIPDQAANSASPKGDRQLDELLAAWEKADKAVKDVHTTFVLTREDTTFRSKEVTRGESWSKKPDLLRFDFKSDQNKLTEICVITTAEMRFFDFKERQEKVFELPKGFPESSVDQGWIMGLFARVCEWNKWIYLGFPVAELKSRFAVRVYKEDKDYFYLEMKPKLKRDRGDFEVFNVVLTKNTFATRTIVVVESSGKRATWDFQRVDPNVVPAISRESISQDLPGGFTRLSFPK